VTQDNDQVAFAGNMHLHLHCKCHLINIQLTLLQSFAFAVVLQLLGRNQIRHEISPLQLCITLSIPLSTLHKTSMVVDLGIDREIAVLHSLSEYSR
jgi:hypothetical protein